MRKPDMGYAPDIVPSLVRFINGFILFLKISLKILGRFQVEKF